MKISSEFSRYAREYNSYNIIQAKVVKKVVESLCAQPKSILDLGCGSGALVKAIDWEYDSFMGVDFAQGMLELHPQSKNIQCLNANFNNAKLFDSLVKERYDYVFSLSSLQWADNLDEVFKNIKRLASPISLAIFTSGTFKTLNKTAGLKALLRSSDTVESLSKKYFNANYEVVSYKLEFESTREMFRYIKKSGVSASRNVLTYKETKKLMKEYPLNYLEFEVIFIESK